MFDDKTVFLIVKENRTEKIYKLEMDAKTQKNINKIFENSAMELTPKQPVIFTGSYSPLADEILCIQNFVLSDDLKDAFRNPVTVESFAPNKTDMQEIKAICIGYCENTGNDEKFIAGFQKFRKDQYIAVDKIRLLYDEKTFKQDSRVGIAISDYIDCLYDGTNLIFNSYYYARQVFNLSEYYRTASNGDIDNFISANIMDFGDTGESFKISANSWIRRKIALINDSGVLTQYKATDIKKLAKKQSNIDIIVKNEKIVFPTDTNEIKIFLSFLDEEAYQGPFSKETFLSNSKRKARE